jgi:molybdopterin synthase catalytic subunit
VQRFRIVDRDIDAEAVRQAVLGPDPHRNPDGAIIVFHGTVRNRTADRRVEHLEYECYEAMALRQMRAIAGRLEEELEISAISCTHRVGHVGIGEDAMVVAVAAPHRAAALEATARFIAELKRDVPIWKKEHFEGGAVWLGTPENPQGESLIADGLPTDSSECGA